MERPSEGGLSNQFSCNICKVACSSAINLQTHFLGSKHKLLEKALKAHGVVKTASPEVVKVPDNDIQPPENAEAEGLEKELYACRSTEPAVGLEHLLEYRTPGNHLWYECELCGCEAGLTNMFMHVVSARHRQAYILKHYPEVGDVEARGSEGNQQLRQMAAEIEAKHGRNHIRVITDTQQLKRKQGNEDAPGPKKIKQIDLSSDEFFFGSPPPAVPPPPPPVPPQSLPPSATFQELKKAHAAAVKKQGLDKSVDGFGTKNELLQYLKQFQIGCEDDAAFILKVTQSFTQSLVNYRAKIKEKAEAAAAAPPVTYPPQQQENSQQPTGQNTYTEYPSKNIPDQQLPAPTGHNIHTEYPPNNMPSQQPPAPTGHMYTEYPPQNMHSQQPSAPIAQNIYNAYPPQNMPSQQSQAPPGHINTEYPPKNLPGQPAPVSLPPNSPYNAGPSSFEPPKPAAPAPANVKGLQSGMGPRPETNKATIEFFTSIKNMNAQQVSATLSKIAATNPALKGIDIPSVIKILQQSGSLKSSNKVNSQM